MGYVCAVTFILTSIIRYAFLYPDEDKVLAYCCIGVLIASVSWLYNKQLQQGIKIAAVEDYLDDKREVLER